MLKKITFEIIKRTLKKSYLNELHAIPMLLIVGSGRSGTTALYDALNCHSMISMYGYEAPIMHHIGELSYEYMKGEFAAYYQDSIKQRKEVFLDDLKLQTLKALFGSDLGLQHHTALQLYRRKPFKNIVFLGTKAFLSEKQEQGLRILFPKMKILYLFRNGLNVVFSMNKFEGFKERGFEETCKLWATAERKYHYLVKHKHSLPLRFEDMVATPAETMKSVLDFLGLTYEESVTNYLQGNINHPLSRKDNEKGSIKEILNSRPSPFTLWDEKHKELFIKQCGASMKNLGYVIK